jgi:hypothetical protein
LRDGPLSVENQSSVGETVTVPPERASVEMNKARVVRRNGLM